MKQQLKGQVMLSLESSGSRMNRLATLALHGEEYRTLDDLLALIDGVTGAEVADVSREVFSPERQTTVVLGPPANG